MKKFVRSIWSNQDGQDIAEYAVMLAVILVIVVGTIRLIGSNANNVFSSVASSVTTLAVLNHERTTLTWGLGIDPLVGEHIEITV
jgi:Flp pilus assembly pilin Flp